VKPIALTILLAGFVCLAPAAWGADPAATAEQAEKDVRGAVEVRRRTQAGEDDWAAERRKMLAAFEALEAARERELNRKETLSARLAEKASSIAAMEDELAALAAVDARLQPWLEQTVERLAEQVRRDLPFLADERRRRIEALRQAVSAPENGSGEKFRRLMEALMVEAEYGSLVEVRRRKIDLEGRAMVADVLRLGRLAYFCQAPDRSASAFYDPVEKRWTRLAKAHDGEIRRAIEMGAKRRSVELLFLPLGRVVPQ
jgi:hypothetical protein